MLTAHVYIINRVQFNTYADAADYAAACGWLIVSWYAQTAHEIILSVVPATVGKPVIKHPLYEQKKEK